tara:strand:- start:151 stop:609 length:459 start_codon:yes stop_codon:yes gene_type:complete
MYIGESGYKNIHTPTYTIPNPNLVSSSVLYDERNLHVHSDSNTKAINGSIFGLILVMAGAYFLYYRYHEKIKRVAKEKAEAIERNKTTVDYMVEEKNKRMDEIFNDSGKLPPPSIMFNVHDMKPSFDASKLLPANDDFVESSYHHRLLPGMN